MAEGQPKESCHKSRELYPRAPLPLSRHLHDRGAPSVSLIVVVNAVGSSESI